MHNNSHHSSHQPSIGHHHYRTSITSASSSSSASNPAAAAHFVHITSPTSSRIAYSHPVSPQLSPASHYQQQQQQPQRPLPAQAVPLRPVQARVTSSHSYHPSSASSGGPPVNDQVRHDHHHNNWSQSTVSQQLASPTRQYKAQPLTLVTSNSNSNTAAAYSGPYATDDVAALSPLPIDTSVFDQFIDDFSTMLDGRTSSEWRSTFANKRNKFLQQQQQSGTGHAYSASYTSSMASSPEPTELNGQPQHYNSSKPSTSSHHLVDNHNSNSRSRPESPNSSGGAAGGGAAYSDYDSPTAYGSRSPAPGTGRQSSGGGGGGGVARSGSLSDFWRDSVHQRNHALNEQVLPSPLATRSTTTTAATSNGAPAAAVGPAWRQQQQRQRTTSPSPFDYPSATMPAAGMTFGTSYNNTQQPSRTNRGRHPNFSELNALIDEVQRLTEEDINDPLGYNRKATATKKEAVPPAVKHVSVSGTTIALPANPAYSIATSDEEFDNVPTSSWSTATTTSPNVSHVTQATSSSNSNAGRVRFQIANSQPVVASSSASLIGSGTGSRQQQKPLVNGHPQQPRLQQHNGQPNFAGLDTAVSLAMMTYDVGPHNRRGNNTTIDSVAGGSSGRVLDQPAMTALGHVGELMRYSADVLQAQSSTTGSSRHKSPKSPTPSTSSMNDNLPSGLPSPRPKHHLREQLIQAGVEPRSPTTPAAAAGRGGNWSFAERASNVNAGSVMARVQQMERAPAPLHQQAAATPVSFANAIHLANSHSQQQQQQPMIMRQPPSSSSSMFVPVSQPVHIASSPTAAMSAGPGSPGSGSPGAQQPVHTSLKTMYEETVYRTKPVIHVNLSVAPQQKAESTAAGGGGGGGTVADRNASSPMQKLTRELEQLQQETDTLNKVASHRQQQQQPTSNSSSRLPPHQQLQQQQHKPLPHVRPGSARNVPRFYFPNGRPPTAANVEQQLQRAKRFFADLAHPVAVEDMPELCKLVNIPLYWKYAVMAACCSDQPQTSTTAAITVGMFEKYWRSMCAVAHDDAARFVYTLTKGRQKYLLRKDLEVLLQDVVATFPGLGFLREAPEFHSRYVQTVISRIFFNVNRSWSGRITATEIRKSNLLETIECLEKVDDINSVTDYFSYEHFYVIYCKFWELDRDHDLMISKQDLLRHGSNAISKKVIDRIFSGAVSRGSTASADLMPYVDFVYFLIAEEDKSHPTSIEYWFRVLDEDGDGVLSLYELESFYVELEQKMKALGIEPMKFNDVICQMLDMINVPDPTCVRLKDLKRGKMAAYFFNAFVNVHKYYEQEVSDGNERAAVEGNDGEQISAWDRFCAEEYEILMQEEQADADEGTEINCDDSDDDDLDGGLVPRLAVADNLAETTSSPQQSQLIRAL